MVCVGRDFNNGARCRFAWQDTAFFGGCSWQDAAKAVLESELVPLPRPTRGAIENWRVCQRLPTNPNRSKSRILNSNGPIQGSPTSSTFMTLRQHWLGESYAGTR